MGLFNNTNCERFSVIAENFVNYILEDRGSGSVEDVVSAFSNAGFTKFEFFQILDKYYLNDYKWAEEPETNEKINTETGEGVFWKEYTEEEKDEEKSTPVPDYFKLIEMLDKVKAPYTNFKKERMIEIKKDYTAVDFLFDENFNLIEVAF